MSYKSYKEIIQETMSLLGGRATVFDIYDFVEKNYKDFIKSKDPKTWRNTVRYNLCKGNFYQLDNDPGISIPGSGVCKYWYNGLSIKIPTQEEVLQKEFEEALRFIDTNKEYQKIMLDNYLEF